MSIKTKIIIYIVISVALSCSIFFIFFLSKLGYLTKEILKNPTSQYVLIQGGFIATLIIVLGFLVSFFLIKHLIGPIELFIKSTSEIAKGNLNYEIQIKSEDELGQLAKNFNQMTKSLKKSQKQLEETRDILEVKVKARTQELEEQAEGLDEQVKIRTIELQERINELERFHKLTVGRELRMIELKQKIQEFEKQIKHSLQKKDAQSLTKKTKKK
jgi:nitrogen fixation/metabolism regulation signal transduction histidine kinase